MIDLALAAVTDVSKARFLVMHTDDPHLAEAALEQLRARLGDAQPRCSISPRRGR